MLEPYSNVERWFYEQASNLLPDIKETDSPEQLCLDEFAIRKGHCYAFALMDPTTGHIWQTSEGKSRKSIRMDYFTIHFDNHQRSLSRI